MTRQQNRPNRLYRNKWRIMLVLLPAIIIICIFIPKQSTTKHKLTGLWNIEFDNSVIKRRNVSEFINNTIDMQNNDTIDFPHVFDTLDTDFKNKTFLDIPDNEENTAKLRKRYLERERKAKGTWRIISTNPDSLLFDAPENPLHGRYAVRFFVDRKGRWNLWSNIYKIALTNDSTYIICNRVSFPDKHEAENWAGED